jgi:hypothetical protein
MKILVITHPLAGPVAAIPRYFRPAWSSLSSSNAAEGSAIAPFSHSIMRFPKVHVKVFPVPEAG